MSNVSILLLAALVISACTLNELDTPNLNITSSITSDAEMGFASHPHGYSCQGGIAFQKRFEAEGVARSAHLDWLKEGLKQKIEKQANLMVAKKECYLRGYDEQRLHSLHYEEHQDKGVTLVVAKAHFSCCDTDRNPSTSPEPRGELHNTADKCRYHLGSDWKDPSGTEAMDWLSTGNDTYDGVKTKIYPVESRFLSTTNLSRIKQRRASLGALITRTNRAKKLCKADGGQLLALNRMILLGVEASSEVVPAIENFSNALAATNVICCVRNE